MSTEAFWLDALANLLATIIGVALGLPIALWLDRMSRRRNESILAAESRHQTQKILSILLAEVEDNVLAMDQLHQDVSNYFYPVQMESWRAFSDGGELKWIHDPALLHKLSLAYAHLRHYTFVLANYFESYTFLARTGNARLAEHQFEGVIRIRNTARASADAACDYLRGKLQTAT